MWVGGLTDTQTLHSAFLCSDNVCSLLAKKKNAVNQKDFSPLLTCCSALPLTVHSLHQVVKKCSLIRAITSIRACIAVEGNKDSLSKPVKTCHYGKIHLYRTFTHALGW